MQPNYRRNIKPKPLVIVDRLVKKVPHTPFTNLHIATVFRWEPYTVDIKPHTFHGMWVYLKRNHEGARIIPRPPPKLLGN